MTASPVNATAVKEQRLSAYRKSAHQARFRVVQDRRDSFDELAEGSPPLENATKQREEYSRGIGRGKSRFTRIWDAVEEAPGRRAGISNGAGTEMDQFEAMLQEYLKGALASLPIIVPDADACVQSRTTLRALHALERGRQSRYQDP